MAFLALNISSNILISVSLKPGAVASLLERLSPYGVVRRRGPGEGGGREGRALHCASREDTLISQCPTPHRFING